ncbi:MAG TPA: hypothetical protein VJR89_01495 [Polyangiales bacterium]|nr:hypothetical protein [Polyangiales bacterium]
MHFTQRLREGVRRGTITCSVRIWQGPRVTPGKRYKLDRGEIEVDSLQEISLQDITPELARESGFASVVDLLKVAQHGRGRHVYLVRFHYVGPRAKKPSAPRAASGERQRKRVLELLKRLPEAQAIAHDSHLSLEVRKKRFGYFLENHHGDRRIALHCKSSPELRDALEQQVPDQIHVPKYVGNKGWIGLWLDVAEVDWSAVALALREAYVLTAPKSLRK